MHPGLGMETFSSDAFTGNPVQVGDALLALFVGWVNLDPDHLGHLRLGQVDQIQRRRRVSRGFFDHHLIGNQLEFVVKGAGTYLLSRFFVDVVHRAFRLLQLQEVGGEGFLHGCFTAVLSPPPGEVEGLECGVDGLTDMQGDRCRFPYLRYPLEEES